MELNEYQEQAMETCMKSCDNFAYMMLNLIGEVGEFASKIAKEIRKGNMEIGGEGSPNRLLPFVDEEDWRSKEEELKKEAGDILWQLSGLCKAMGWALEEVGRMNLEKLASRKLRGVIEGNGDNR